MFPSIDGAMPQHRPSTAAFSPKSLAWRSFSVQFCHRRETGLFQSKTFTPTAESERLTDGAIDSSENTSSIHSICGVLFFSQAGGRNRSDTGIAKPGM